MKLSSGLWLFTYSRGEIGILKVTGDKAVWVYNPLQWSHEIKNDGWAGKGWIKISVKYYYESY